MDCHFENPASSSRVTNCRCAQPSSKTHGTTNSFMKRTLSTFIWSTASPWGAHGGAKCDGEQGMLTKRYPRKAQRRRKCSTAPNIFSKAQRSGAPSVTESLVSSGTTPAELAFVQRSALLASRRARRATAGGYADLRRPDQALKVHREDLEPSVFSLMPASGEEEPI
jgi:hypothetical protein